MLLLRCDVCFNVVTRCDVTAVSRVCLYVSCHKCHVLVMYVSFVFVLCQMTVNDVHFILQSIYVYIISYKYSYVFMLR